MVKKKEVKIHKQSRQQPNVEEDASVSTDGYEQTSELHYSMLEAFLRPDVLFLIGVAVVFIAIKNTYTQYAGWFVLLIALFIPLIRQLSKR